MILKIKVIGSHKKSKELAKGSFSELYNKMCAMFTHYTASGGKCAWGKVVKSRGKATCFTNGDEKLFITKE